MSDLVRTLAAYLPPAITRTTLTATTPDPPTKASQQRYPAAVLFADVSGFTPLTERLAQKGSEGPEELTRLLNRYFSRMIALIESQGGEVVKFSGDAVTALFPATEEALAVATRRAWQAAEAMQAAMHEFAVLETSVGPIDLGMKIGIGAGPVLAMEVGGFEGRWEPVIAGEPLRQATESEEQAERGTIRLSPEAEAIILPQSVTPRPLPQPDWAQIKNPAAVEAVLKCYVPGVVTTWLQEALQEWLAVLRPMSVLFANVTGLDYAQLDVVQRLHAFLRVVQQRVSHYEGTINKLAVDDKGTTLLILFGAPPRAHEDDPERALGCALELQTVARTQELELTVGATTGRVFAGPVGGVTRREYTVMGDTVNLAARLMSLAETGQVLCGYETYGHTRDTQRFEALAPVHVKGKAGLIRVYRLTGETRETTETTVEEEGGTLIGRQEQVAQLSAGLDRLQTNQGGILLIEGEAGIGKSRLVEELIRLMRERGIAGLRGWGRSIEQQTPYRAWRDIFRSYFDLEGVQDPEERRHRVLDQGRDVSSELEERLPLLNDVLNLDLPENDLTATMDAELRHESLVALLLALLRAWTDERPLVLVLEDAHWLDSLSWDLTLQVARAFSPMRARLLLVVVMRPMVEDTARREPQLLTRIETCEHVHLAALAPEEAVALAAARLSIAPDDLPTKLAQLIQDRSGGNPFFAEELVYALRDNGLISVERREGQTHCILNSDLNQVIQTLPDTIQGIVLSRIDRLPPEEQLTLKVAAVIGRTFAYTPLHDTLGQHMEISHRLLQHYLSDLSRLDLTPLETPEPELTYIFKHIITQEVAYETLLFAQRRQLHRTVARWYERQYGDGPTTLESPLARYSPLLVYHWHQAQDRERERHYATLAGRWAAAQFANVEAAGYLDRALSLTPESDRLARYELLLGREGVNDLRGERETQARDLAELAKLAAQMQEEQRIATVALRQSNYHEVTSDYEAALQAAQQAIAGFRRAQDRAGESAGQMTLGKVLRAQGDYAAARSALTQALAMARKTNNRSGEAQSLYDLGHVFLLQGDYAVAQEHYRQALDIHQAIGQRQGEADSFTVLGVTYEELGDYSSARDYYERALAIYQAIGDRRGATLTLNNLGVVYCDLGALETARDYHQQALEIRRTIGDRWGEANSLVNLGLVYHGLEEDETTRRYCQQALEIQREIGDRRGQGYSLTYLGHALLGLGELDTAADAYERAMNLRRELGQDGLAIDDLAGQARVALARGDLVTALQDVEEILDWIAGHGLESIEYPLQVYLTCYRVLQANAQQDPPSQERAREVLQSAHQALLERAAGIRDEALRHNFIENVETHRAIAAAWKSG